MAANITPPLDIAQLEKVMPPVYSQLREITTNLEKHYRDVQDFEFTVQDGKLYMLQTRNGKRTGPAAVRIAVDMVNEKLISKEEAVLRVDPQQLDQLLPEVLDPAAKAAARVRACRHRLAPPWAAWCSPPMKPSYRPQSSRSSWCAPKPCPMIFTAWKSPKEFSLRAAA